MGQIACGANMQEMEQAIAPSPSMKMKMPILTEFTETKEEPVEPTNSVHPSPSPDPNAPVSFWNFHHFVEEIEPILASLVSKPPNSSAPSHKHSMADIEWISEQVKKIYQGITHNAIDGLPNERALVDFWKTVADHSNTIILFEFADIDEMYESVGFDIADETMKKAYDVLQEAIDWFQEDESCQCYAFHPDTNMYQFVVITDCTKDTAIRHFARCYMSDAKKQVKVFPYRIRVCCGFVIREYPSRMDEVSFNAWTDFRLWYQRSLSALKKAFRVSNRYDDVRDCIQQWISLEKRRDYGRKILRTMYESAQIRRVLAANPDYDKAAKMQQKLDVYDGSIKHWLRDRADIDYADEQTSNCILQHALIYGDYNLVQYILQNYEVNADHQNDDGETVLMTAVRTRAPEIVCCAITQQVEYPNLCNNNNETISRYCVKAQYWEVLKHLKHKSLSDDRAYVFEALIKKNAQVFQIHWEDFNTDIHIPFDSDGNSILHFAVLYNVPSVVLYLLRYQQGRLEGINKPGDFSQYVNARNLQGFTAIALACHKQLYECVEILMQFHADTRIKTMQHISCYDMALQKKDRRLLVAIEDYEREKYRIYRKDSILYRRRKRSKASVPIPFEKRNEFQAIVKAKRKSGSQNRKRRSASSSSSVSVSGHLSIPLPIKEMKEDDKENYDPKRVSLSEYMCDYELSTSCEDTEYSPSSGSRDVMVHRHRSQKSRLKPRQTRSMEVLLDTP